MTCLGNADDASFYSGSFASGKLELYPFVEPLPDGWCAVEWSGPPINFQATVSHGKYLSNSFIEWRLTCESPESTALAKSYTTHTEDYGQPSYTKGYWPGVDYKANLPHPGSLGWDGCFTSTAGSETSTVTKTSTSGKQLRSLKIREIENSLVTNSPVQLSGGWSNFALHQQVLYRKHPDSTDLVHSH